MNFRSVSLRRAFASDSEVHPVSHDSGVHAEAKDSKTLRLGHAADRPQDAECIVVPTAGHAKQNTEASRNAVVKQDLNMIQQGLGPSATRAGQSDRAANIIDKLLHRGLKSQYGDGNMRTVAEQQMLLKIAKVHGTWPTRHSYIS